MPFRFARLRAVFHWVIDLPDFYEPFARSLGLRVLLRDRKERRMLYPFRRAGSRALPLPLPGNFIADRSRRRRSGGGSERLRATNIDDADGLGSLVGRQGAARDVRLELHPRSISTADSS